MELLPLHKHLNYLDDCAEVLNEEWTRSKNARLHSLEKSCDQLPTCLILLDENKKVIGHSRLSQLRGHEGACLVESVVVRKGARGHGHGRTVMVRTEEYAKSKGFQTMYLTTHDKQEFYKKLGYEFCEPVVSFGGDFANLPESFTKALAGLSGSAKPGCGISEQNKKEKIEVQRTPQLVPQTQPLVPTPPSGSPAPAQPPSLPLPTLAPAALPPPPPRQAQCVPPSPPLHPSPQTASQLPAVAMSAPLPPPPPRPQAKSSIVRWDPAKVSWMKKHL